MKNKMLNILFYTCVILWAISMPLMVLASNHLIVLSSVFINTGCVVVFVLCLYELRRIKELNEDYINKLYNMNCEQQKSIKKLIDEREDILSALNRHGVKNIN